MLKDMWYDEFLNVLLDKYPKKNQLVESLMDLLHIEREAVYRRLRKDVLFTVHEIAQIATAWNISIDNILGLYSNEFWFKIWLADHLSPSEEDARNLQIRIHGLEKVIDIPDLESMEISNRLPRMLTIGFPLINRLSLLRWVYHAGTSMLPFSKIAYSEEASKHAEIYCEAVKRIPQINIVIDARALKYLVEDILYFHSISLVSDSERELLKKELYEVLDYGNEIVQRGSWPETGNKVYLYISQLNVDTSYNYHYYNGAARSCSIRAFGRSEIYSENKVVIEKVKAMMDAKKQSSILISGVNEQSRIAYFKEQRKIVDRL